MNSYNTFRLGCVFFFAFYPLDIQVKPKKKYLLADSALDNSQEIWSKTAKTPGGPSEVLRSTRAFSPS